MENIQNVKFKSMIKREAFQKTKFQYKLLTLSQNNLIIAKFTKTYLEVA